MADEIHKPPQTEPTVSPKVAAARAAVRESVAHLEAAIAVLRPHTTTLLAQERATSSGKLRTGEADILREVLTAAEQNPALVAGHSDADEGQDPNRFETELLREWFDLHAAFAEGAREAARHAELLNTLLSDSAMFYGARARRPTLRVYADLAALAQHNAPLRDQLRNAITFFGDIVRKGQRTLRGKQA